MFIPPNVKSLKFSKEPQIRLGIQGWSGTGKTWAALTFPNPIVVDIDRGLGAHYGRNDVLVVPFYDMTFCKSVSPNYKGPSQLKDLILKWLYETAMKLDADQTLVWDGGTGTQRIYHEWYSENKVFSVKTGKEDDYAQWRLKIEFFGELTSIFKQLKCNVVYICHEYEKEKLGESNKLRPLLTGQFNSELGSHFTDWVRQHTSDKPKDFKSLDEKKLKLWGMTSVSFEEMCKTFPGNTLYYWQLESDDLFDGKISSLLNYPRFIPANYISFRKYMRVEQVDDTNIEETQQPVVKEDNEE